MAHFLKKNCLLIVIPCATYVPAQTIFSIIHTLIPWIQHKHYKDPQDTRQRYKYVFKPRIYNSLSDCLCILHVDWYGRVNIWEAMWIQYDYLSNSIKNIELQNLILFHNVAHSRLLIVLLLVYVSPLWWYIHAPKLWYLIICCNGHHDNFFLFRKWKWVGGTFNVHIPWGSWNTSIKCSPDIKTYKSSWLLEELDQ